MNKNPENYVLIYRFKLLFRVFILLFGLLSSYNSYAQKKDTNYIAQFYRPYNIQLNSWLNNFDFYINPPRFSNSRELLKLSPNLSWQTGVSLGLKYFTVSLGVQVPGTNGDEKTFGRTNFYDFSFSYYQSRWGGEIYSRSFSGIYRTLGVDTNLSIRPDVKILANGLNLFYNFNHRKFSYRSALSMAEFQRKSSGAMLMMCNLGFKSIQADSSLIPPNIDSKQNYGELSQMNHLRLWHINFRPGYAYNFCFKGGTWFISPSAFLGLGLASFMVVNPTTTKKGINFDADTHAKLSMGRNGDQYFWNVFVNYDASLNAFGYPNFVAFQSTSFGFNIGYRFYRLIPKIKWL
ncbi:MAG: DUF4421 family protein [Bacteroidota bacterium]